MRETFLGVRSSIQEPAPSRTMPPGSPEGIFGSSWRESRCAPQLCFQNIVQRYISLFQFGASWLIPEVVFQSFQDTDHCSSSRPRG
ncbi:hypothetical protein RND71_043093 [Anisodus tanguticus]|uniref:Uncharacterized protein n=1 Tax=Anisodus tanguticus TaxID=243964 RepID=A0AAE1USX7_9SOLA|nr:hypothetical protein RND71_043093 [Anisodus tanguticus]